MALARHVDGRVDEHGHAVAAGRTGRRHGAGLESGERVEGAGLLWGERRGTGGDRLHEGRAVGVVLRGDHPLGDVVAVEVGGLGANQALDLVDLIGTQTGDRAGRLGLEDAERTVAGLGPGEVGEVTGDDGLVIVVGDERGGLGGGAGALGDGLQLADASLDGGDLVVGVGDLGTRCGERIVLVAGQGGALLGLGGRGDGLHLGEGGVALGGQVGQAGAQDLQVLHRAPFRSRRISVVATVRRRPVSVEWLRAGSSVASSSVVGPADGSAGVGWLRSERARSR